MPKLIAINGPPGAGKDTLGLELEKLLTDDVHVKRVKFAGRLKAATAALLAKLSGCGPPCAEDLERLKDEKDPFGVWTWRDWFIAVSEKLVKPLVGQQAFGLALKADLERSTGVDIFIATDCGFEPELQVFTDDPNWEVMLIRITRPGCDFSSDSRGFVSPERLDVTAYISVNNRGTVDELTSSVRYFVRTFVSR